MGHEPTKPGPAIGRLSGATLCLTGLLYLWSCFLPATDIGSISEASVPYPGGVHLAFGWMAGLKGLPAWSANFVLAAACWCLLRSRFRAAAVLGVAAPLLGLTTPFSYKMDARYAGYDLWQTSQFVFAIGAVSTYFVFRKRRAADVPSHDLTAFRS